MSNTKKIKTALVSVYHKDRMDEICNKLHQQGVQIISTGGTKSFIEELDVPVTAVEELTSYRITSYNVCYTKLLRFWVVPNCGVKVNRKAGFI